MNPARSIGPQIVGNEFGLIWIYAVGPCIGAALAESSRRSSWARRARTLLKRRRADGLNRTLLSRAKMAKAAFHDCTDREDNRESAELHPGV